MPAPKFQVVRFRSYFNRIGIFVVVFSLLGSVFFLSLFVAIGNGFNSEMGIVVSVLCALSILAVGALARRSIWLEKENTRLIAAVATESERVEKLLRETSHDLRNALASVLTGSEVLLTVDKSPDAKPLLKSIQRQAKVVAQIVDRLIDDYKTIDFISPVVEKHSQLEDVHKGAEEFTGDQEVSLKSVPKRMPLRILAIDDRRDVLLPLRVLLTKEGHEFSEAEDGLSGLEKVATFGPEIVLCDINLPGKLSGLDVARNIRMLNGSEMYLVAISGNFQVSDLESSANAGFDFHIAKPITAVALRNLIYNRPKFELAESGISSGN